MTKQEIADLVSFDFTLDNILSVKAPRGTRPEDLHGELRDKLTELLATETECFIFERIYEDEEEDWFLNEVPWEEYFNNGRQA